MLTILIRTCNRPKAFKRCIQSIDRQTVKPSKLIINEDGFNIDNQYVYDTMNKCNMHVPYALTFYTSRTKKPFHYNLYYNRMVQDVPADSWIMFLDDDDHFVDPDALYRITSAAHDTDRILLWRVNINGRIVPNRVGEPPTFGNISGIGFAIHRSQWLDWKAQRGGDHNVISRYIEKGLKPTWIDYVLTGTQGAPGEGRQMDF